MNLVMLNFLKNNISIYRHNKTIRSGGVAALLLRANTRRRLLVSCTSGRKSHRCAVRVGGLEPDWLLCEEKEPPALSVVLLVVW